jgi:hypothetical protein
MHSADGNLGGKVIRFGSFVLSLSLCMSVSVPVPVFLSFIDVIILYT